MGKVRAQMASVLVVEDYADNRSIIEYILRDAEYNVQSAVDGITAIELATADQPDVILMDLALPKMDGWEAIKRLKADPKTSHIPVLAFTAHLDSESLRRAVAAGCVGVVAKPFDIDGLLATISACLPVA